MVDNVGAGTMLTNTKNIINLIIIFRQQLKIFNEFRLS